MRPAVKKKLGWRACRKIDLNQCGPPNHLWLNCQMEAGQQPLIFRCLMLVFRSLMLGC
jgi:hypothetical protein